MYDYWGVIRNLEAVRRRRRNPAARLAILSAFNDSVIQRFRHSMVNSVFNDKYVFVGALHVVLLAGNLLQLIVVGKEVVEALAVAADLRLIKSRFALQAVELEGYGDVLFEAVAVKKANPNRKKEERQDCSHVADAYILHEQADVLSCRAWGFSKNSTQNYVFYSYQSPQPAAVALNNI
jgi:hypothetical protein